MKSKESIIDLIHKIELSLNWYAGGDEYTAERQGVIEALKWVLENKELDPVLWMVKK